MNSYTTVTLLPTTEYGTASGNYDGSSQEFTGNSVPAANYYAGQGNLQTIAYNVIGFQGVITIQATLQDNPDQSAWFDIDTFGDGSTVVTEYHPVSVIGNFAHLRAYVTQFDSGTITVTASY
jgi:hypothetical protein